MLQTLIVMPVVLALAYGIAVVVDAALGHGIRMLHWIRHDDGRRTVSGMPRSRVTLALVALLILVLVVWLLNR